MYNTNFKDAKNVSYEQTSDDAKLLEHHFTNSTLNKLSPLLYTIAKNATFNFLYIDRFQSKTFPINLVVNFNFFREGERDYQVHQNILKI